MSTKNTVTVPGETYRRPSRSIARPGPRSILWLVCAAGLNLSLAGCLTEAASESLLERVFPGLLNPGVTSVAPQSGPADGGTEVTIQGNGFGPEIGVLFGDQAAINAECVNEGLMRATTPPHGAGTVPVVLVDLYGQEVPTDFSFTYLTPEEPAQPAAPVIVTIEPDRGPVGGGTPVTITGSGFGTDVGVLFGDAAPAEFTVVNDSLIMVITPAHEVGVVDVAVFTGGGRTDVVVGGFAFVTPDQVALVIDAVTPSSGPSDGGTMVTIEGSGFVVGTAVFFGSSAASDITVVNDGVITAKTPAHAEGDVLVELRAPDGREATADQLFTYYFGRDSDGDGLSDIQETEGWDIWVDYFGIGLGVDTYGNFPGLYSVTSDPDNPDTDGDGLSDHEEYLIISDPRKIDTDEDGLLDAEEVDRWWTSPISVDTDGDCRGPTGDLVPNANLFDGAELGIDFDNDPTHTPAQDATSPTLADTDGDGRTDWEEFDHPWRSPLIADLPRVELTVADDIDIRLNVEYAEEEGQTTEYGHAITEGSEDTFHWYTGGTASLTLGFSLMVGGEVKAKAGVLQWGEVTTKAEATVSTEVGYSQEWQVGGDYTDTFQEENSRMEGKSFTHTETAASGSISTGIVLTNTGPVSYHLANLGMTVRLFERAIDFYNPQAAGSYKTVATLAPVLGEGFTLAPDQSTPIIQVQAQDVNVDLIRSFMRNPRSLHLEQAYYELEAEGGLNYAFLEEITRARTATISIDFGDGEWRQVRLATNVRRSADGSYDGIRLGDALDLAGIEFRTELNYDISDPNSPIPTRRVLTQVQKEDGAWVPADPDDNDVYAFWMTIGSNDSFEDTDLDFEDILLHAGDFASLVFTEDADEDGLYGWDESHYGTSDDPNNPNNIDYDGDGLIDFDEVSPREVDPNSCDDPPCYAPAGWDVQVLDQPLYRVYSDPRAADADGDGLSDLEERGGCEIDGLLDYEYLNEADCTAQAGVWHPFAGAGCVCGEDAAEDCSELDDQPTCEANGGVWTFFGTDPSLADTDGDGLEDGVDELPLVEAKRFHVDTSNADPPEAGDPNAGLSWGMAFVDLQSALALAAVLNNDGDPANDISQIWVTQGVYTPDPDAEEGSYDRDASFVLQNRLGIYGGFQGGETKRGERVTDPFTCNTFLSGDLLGNDSGGSYGDNSYHVVSDGTGGLDETAILDGFVIMDGRAAQVGGGGLTLFDSTPTLRNLLFTRNYATGYSEGGAMYILDCGSPTDPLRLVSCVFLENVSGSTGGAIRINFTYDEWEHEESHVECVNCLFDGNVASDWGGAVDASAWGSLTLTRCTFRGNHAGLSGGGVVLGEIATVDRCLFTENTALDGGGLSIQCATFAVLTQCTFTLNDATSHGGAISSGLIYGEHCGTIHAINCTVCNNTAGDRGGGIGVRWGGVQGPETWLTNCIFYGNDADGDPANTEFEQLYLGETETTGVHLTMNHTCVEGLSWLGQFGVENIGTINPDEDADGYVLDSFGLVGLLAGSPCIDGGYNWVDVDPLTPGLQLLPDYDMLNGPRILDGDGDGIAIVDMGACEH